MKFLDFLKENIVYADGGTGTLLQERGLRAGELPERWNITHADEITAIHQAYFDAGSNLVCTNTFGANALHYAEEELEEIITKAVEHAKRARENSTFDGEKFIALDIGPSGKLLRPYGDLDFEDAVALFAKTVKIGARCGVDLVFIETMNDSYETKAALLAVKENCDLPVIVSNAYGADGKLTTGATPSAMVAMLESIGADAIGANCSLGPQRLVGVMEELLERASVPVLMKPNAGMPCLQNGTTVYAEKPEEFAEVVATLVQKGVRIIGGCCGTTPAYIKALRSQLQGVAPRPIQLKTDTVVSSYTHAVYFGGKPLLIGERVNPTGKKRLKQAIIEDDIDYILQEGVTQVERGADILDVNVGIPDIDEPRVLEKTVCALQEVTDVPLQIDTANISAMERALRRYNGKALINSVNGKKESMESVFPLVKKYGGVVVALTLDEDGIPQKDGDRVAIAEKILQTASRYGIQKKDIIFDTLAMAVSADNSAPQATLSALKRVTTELGCHTSLGVSNVSFGLPNRDIVNATFFALALENGLSAAIMNPYSAEMMKTYYAYNLLKGHDGDCQAYLANAPMYTSASVQTATQVVTETAIVHGSALQDAIVKGLKTQAKMLTDELLKTHAPMDIINGEIIPAINAVGENFEKKKCYLPQLLISAETAKTAFERIKESTIAREQKDSKKACVVLATVRGDIHDIGKNIVKLLLENYGFEVVDLGKDVPSERIVETVCARKAEMVALSALMTTTLPSMEETVLALRARAPWCKVMVGGAVLTQDYAERTGADAYAKDAMEAVRIAERWLAETKKA